MTNGQAGGVGPTAPHHPTVGLYFRHSLKTLPCEGERHAEARRARKDIERGWKKAATPPSRGCGVVASWVIRGQIPCPCHWVPLCTPVISQRSTHPSRAAALCWHAGARRRRRAQYQPGAKPALRNARWKHHAGRAGPKAARRASSVCDGGVMSA
eukprot:scaffold1090_cov135-Isochrysis_galbana.AAC.7